MNPIALILDVLKWVISIRSDGEAEPGDPAIAVRESPARMHARDGCDDGQPQAVMRLAFAAARALGAEEAVEKARQLRGLDLHAVILHQDPDLVRFIGADLHDDLRTRIGEADRVAK